MPTKMSPRTAQTVYNLGIIATSVVAIAGIWNAIDGATATALGSAIAALLSLFGVGATATAGVRVSRQRKDGMLDFTGPPAQQAVDAIAAVAAQAETSASDRDKIMAAAGALAGTIPVVGPLAQQVIDSVR